MLVIYSSQPARFIFETADGRVRSTADGAEEGARAMLDLIPSDAPLPDPLLAAVPAVLAPLNALVGAVAARREVLNWTELRRTEAELMTTASNVCAQAQLRDAFLAAVGERTRCRWQAATQALPIDTPDRAYQDFARLGFDTTLELRADALRLQRTGRSDTSYALFIDGRVRLVRTAEATVLYDQPFSYRSGTSLFVDWTLNGAEPFQRVAAHGYALIADQAFQQLWQSQSPPTDPARADRRMANALAKPSATPALMKARSNQGVVQVVRTPLTPKLVAHLGTVGIISTNRFPGKIQLQRPLTKDQAADHARVATRDLWAGNDADLEKVLSTPYVNALAVATLVPIGIVEQVANGCRGLTEKRLQTSDQALSSVVQETNLQDAIRGSVANRIHSLTKHPVQLVQKQLPPGLEQDCSQMSCFMAGTLSWVPDNRAPAFHLREQGIDTALEIELVRAALNGTGTVNPPMRLTLDARANLIRTQNAETFYSVSVQYRSPERKFSDWAAMDGQALRVTIQHCVESVSAAIVDELAVPAWTDEPPIEIVEDRD